MAEEKRYVDAAQLMNEVLGIYPSSTSSYSGGQVDSQINSLINMALTNAFESFKSQLAAAISRSSVPYDKCMLCVRRDCDMMPDHPLGDNR